MNITANEYCEYAVEIRRILHQYPEIGFNLERTVALVSEELDKAGIPYTYKYGKSSVVAELGKGNTTIALRADMDALPVEEKTSLSYKSKIPGQMHACGHDAHTAILLAVAKYLKKNENKLNCKIRLIFQPSEEGQVSGAKMMVDNGVMNGVDHIICTHCANTIDAGKLGTCAGNHMAACIPATIRFFGKSSHATLPQFGIDANAMAIEAYRQMKEAVDSEAGSDSYIWCVGRISGGHVHNVISDLCEMDISFRFYDMDFAKRVEKSIKTICTSVAESFGGKCEINWNISTGPVYNNEDITYNFEKILSEENIHFENIKSRMSSEDFGWYLTKVPGMLFRFGTGGKDNTTVAHNNDFYINEEGMKTAIHAFCAYVMNYSEEQ